LTFLVGGLGALERNLLILFHNLDYGAPGEAGVFQPVKVRLG
jgi:hypothetical protein